MSKEQGFILQELEARKAALWDVVESYDDLPLDPEEVRAAIEELDDDAIVAAFKESIQLPNDDFQGLYYEWYYGGDPDVDVAYGYVSAECSITEFSGTDFIDSIKKAGGPGLERESPDGFDEFIEDELGYIEVNQVMERYYGEFGLDGEYDLDSDVDHAYNELFRIKMYELVYRTFSELWQRRYRNRPKPYVYMSLHERWNVLVYAPESDTAEIPANENNADDFFEEIKTWDNKQATFEDGYGPWGENTTLNRYHKSFDTPDEMQKELERLKALAGKEYESFHAEDFPAESSQDDLENFRTDDAHKACIIIAYSDNDFRFLAVETVYQNDSEYTGSLEGFQLK
jgi:hypothetical protein